MAARGVALGVTQHSRELVDAVLAVYGTDVAGRQAPARGLRHHEVVIGSGSDLREVGDHEDLPPPRHLRERFPHLPPDLAADSLIHLVEDERGDGVVSRQHDLEREHDPRQLSA